MKGPRRRFLYYEEREKERKVSYRSCLSPSPLPQSADEPDGGEETADAGGELMREEVSQIG